MPLNPEDLKIDTYSVHGMGWSLAVPYVQVVHTPSKIGVTVGTERSQYANKEKALELLEALLLAMASEKPFPDTGPQDIARMPTADRVYMIKEVRTRTGCGLKEAKEAVDLTGSIEGAMIHLTGRTGYCIEGEGCVCGGDVPEIREGCYNWKR